MSSKNNAQVIIDGKIFTLSGYESEEYLQKVATYINNKIAEFKKDEGYRRQTIDVQKALLDLNIADDYFKAKKQADALETELESKDKQLYDIKHELITAQINNETLEKERDDLKAQLGDAQKDMIRYETRIMEMKENQNKEASKPAKRTSKATSKKAEDSALDINLSDNIQIHNGQTEISEADRILNSLGDNL
ncbi:MAG: cell division protein ZapA [Lachnospiraceae bacterium]|nr:cell division protein ZapA [Lachnospiraceae bacterium]